MSPFSITVVSVNYQLLGNKTLHSADTMHLRVPYHSCNWQEARFLCTWQPALWDGTSCAMRDGKENLIIDID